MDIAVRALDYGFADRTGLASMVFKGFDLDVRSGEMHAVVGRSGCGKSTLLRLLAGVEKPWGGTIDFGGPSASANRAALIFQDPTLLPWWNVGRNVGTGAEFDERRRPLYDRIRRFGLDRVGLRALANRAPHTLSRGQQTRVGIGRALAHDAAVTLLDEPFVHLDALTRQRMWEEFETHWLLEARTYVLVTHDIDEAVLLSDRVTVLSSKLPATVVDTVEVDLERPRFPDRMSEPGFRSAVAQVWAALDQD